MKNLILFLFIFSFFSFSKGASLDDSIIKAAGAGDLKKVKVLINKGANVNAKTKGGMLTPLHLAVVNMDKDKPYLEVAKHLIENGANVNAKTKYGATPLFFATRGQPLDLSFELAFKFVKLLVESGADVNAKEGLGRTPLHSAYEFKNNHKMRNFLIKNGADPNILNKEGKKPEDLARD